jgi:2-dehydropantoate 2-reductase
LGSLVAALLAVGGGDETWLVGGESSAVHLDAIARDGLRVALPAQVASALDPALAARLGAPVRGIRVTGDAAAARPCELAVILVKSYRNAQAAAQARELLAPGGVALSLQNGLGNREELAALLPGRVVAQGSTLMGATLLGPGEVLAASLGVTTIGAGPELPAALRLILERFAAALGQGGAAAELAADVAGVVWGKLVVNCAINPVASLLDVPNGALVESESAQAAMAPVVAEALAVARAAGVALPFADDAALPYVLDVARATAANICSMLQDLRRSRPTEIEALNGAVAREAARLGVATPVNAALTSLVRARERLKKRG